MSTTQTKNINGWLKYGSDDPSVLFYDPLTSVVNTVVSGGRIPAATRLISAGGGGVVGDIIHNSILGYKPYNDGTKWAAYRFQTFSDVGDAKVADLANAGQITFEVEKAFLTRIDANSESTGASLATDQTLLSFLMVTGTYRFLQRFITGDVVHNNFGVAVWNNFYTGLQSVLALSSWGRSEFIKVNIGWDGGKAGGKVYIAFDDQVVAYAVRNQVGTGTPSDMFIGSSSGSQTTMTSGHFMRNLQVSTKPPNFSVEQKLRNIVIWGDSQVLEVGLGDGTGMNYNIAPYLASTVGLELAKNLNAKGLFANIKTRGYGGYSIATDGVHTSLATTAAALKLLNPEVVLLEAGTNDAVGVGGALYSAFETDFRALLVDMLAHPTVKFIGLRTVPSGVGHSGTNTAAFIANRLAINVIIAGMPAYINATYPQHVGKVAYGDSYIRLGGESPPAGTFYGQLPGGKLSGVPNNLHYAAAGAQVEGAAWANLLITKYLG